MKSPGWQETRNIGKHFPKEICSKQRNYHEFGATKESVETKAYKAQISIFKWKPSGKALQSKK